MKSLIINSYKNSINLDINSMLTPLELFKQLFKNDPDLFSQLFGTVDTEMMRCDIKTLSDIQLALVDSKHNSIYEYDADEPIFCGLSEISELNNPSYIPVFMLRGFEFSISTFDNSCYKDECDVICNDILSKITGELAINNCNFSFAPEDNTYFKSWNFGLTTDSVSKGYHYEMKINYFPSEDKNSSALDADFTYRSDTFSNTKLFNRIANDIATDKIGVSNNIKVTLETCPDGKFRIKMVTIIELLGEISYDKLGVFGFELNIAALEEYIAEIKKE